MVLMQFLNMPTMCPNDLQLERKNSGNQVETTLMLKSVRSYLLSITNESMPIIIAL